MFFCFCYFLFLLLLLLHHRLCLQFQLLLIRLSFCLWLLFLLLLLLILFFFNCTFLCLQSRKNLLFLFSRTIISLYVSLLLLFHFCMNGAIRREKSIEINPKQIYGVYFICLFLYYFSLTLYFRGKIWQLCLCVLFCCVIFLRSNHFSSIAIVEYILFQYF